MSRSSTQPPERDAPVTFDLLHVDSETRARVGVIHTPHGDLDTPLFCPVGTQATVKTLAPTELTAMGASMILGNTYHLYLRPGTGVIAAMGGLHQFMGWDRAILTDSGGFQVFSLRGLRTVDQDGVTFRSHIDGSEHRFTPERVVHIQEQLGADIAMVLDECAEPQDRAYNVEALRRTHLWAERSLRAHSHPKQALFAIVQGGVFADLRAESAQVLTEMDFAGYGIGGLSVGESKVDMLRMLDVVAPLLPVHKPRYLMGVGSPEDLVASVALGVDMFDCVLPTRLARNGALYTPTGRINLRNARFRDDLRPVQDDCDCYTCQHFARAYLRHLLIARETLGLRLNTIHNVHFTLELMRTMRHAVVTGGFSEFAAEFHGRYRPVDPVARDRNRRLWQARKAAQG